MKITKINYKKAFTLIELLVVISIIALLSSIVLAALNDARSKARDTARIQSMLQTRNALQLYFADKGQYPLMSSVQANSNIWKSGQTSSTNYGGLLTLGYINDVHPEIRYHVGKSDVPITSNSLCSSHDPSNQYKCVYARIYVKLENKNSVLNSDRDRSYDVTSVTYVPDGLSTKDNCEPEAGVVDSQDLCFDLELVGQ